MAYPVAQSSYTSGELAPSLAGRVDLAKFRVGLATQLNWYSIVHGGSTTRPGTAFVGEIIDNAARGRLMRFQFSTTQTYALEFGNLTMRVIREGGYVLETAGAITGITQANPAVVTQVAHGYTTGDDVWIASVGGMTEVNLRRYRIIVLTANTFSLVGVNSTGFAAYTAGGTGARVYTLVTPYVTADLPLLKVVQSLDTMTITHPSYAPRNLTRSGHAAWSLATITFAPDTAAPTGVYSTNPGAGFGYVMTAINDDTGEESLPSSPVTDSVNETSTLGFTPVTGCTYYNVYKGINGLYGFIGQCTAVGGAFTDRSYAAATDDTPPRAGNPFDAADKYPGCSTYWAQRQIFGRTNTKRQSLFATQTGLFKNMNTSAPLKDDDAIVKTLVAREANEIRSIVPLNDLLVFTSAGAWVAEGGQAITPSTLDPRMQNECGVSHLPPLVINSDVLFAADVGGAVYGIAFKFEAAKYLPTEVSILSSHLFEGYDIAEWAFARAPHKLVWAVRDDGVLLTLTYHKEQEIYGWARHVTDGFVESVCSVREGREDAVYFIVRRVINGVTKRYVERLKSRLFTSLTESWCVDSGVRYSGSPASIISGLDHLEGKDVRGLADGVAFSATVEDGAITLDDPASVVIVGLPYVCDMQTLGVEVGPPTVQGKEKSVEAVTLRLKDTRGITVGRDALDLSPLRAGIYGDVGDVKSETTQGELFTGDTDPVIGQLFDTAGSILIRQSEPMPATVLADILRITVDA